MQPIRRAEPNSRSKYYPRFSDEEFDRRRAAVRDFMGERDLQALVLFGDAGFHQSNLSYLTNYRPPFPTYLAFFADPSEPSTIFVGISNHVQYVREVSVVDDIQLLLPDPPTTLIERLREAGVATGRIGTVGGDPRYNLGLPYEHHRRLDDAVAGELVDVTGAYTRLVSVLGDEELELVRRAARILDGAMEALEVAIEPGVTELELAAELRDAVGEAGGDLGTDFISSAPMSGAEPGEPLPWKAPSARQLAEGDVVTTEISAGPRGYHTQIHRPFAVGVSPTDEYRALFDVAEEAYHRMLDALQPGNDAAAVAEAAASIEASEYKIYDVLCHGYGAGYRPPFIGVESSNYWPGVVDPLTAEWRFEPGMVVVIQPNVVTPDERAGLQFGTTVLVREDGPEVLQTYPPAFIEV